MLYFIFIFLKYHGYLIKIIIIMISSPKKSGKVLLKDLLNLTNSQEEEIIMERPTFYEDLLVILSSKDSKAAADNYLEEYLTVDMAETVSSRFTKQFFYSLNKLELNNIVKLDVDLVKKKPNVYEVLDKYLKENGMPGLREFAKKIFKKIEFDSFMKKYENSSELLEYIKFNQQNSSEMASNQVDDELTKRKEDAKFFADQKINIKEKQEIQEPQNQNQNIDLEKVKVENDNSEMMREESFEEVHAKEITRQNQNHITKEKKLDEDDASNKRKENEKIFADQKINIKEKKEIQEPQNQNQNIKLEKTNVEIDNETLIQKNNNTKNTKNSEIMRDESFEKVHAKEITQVQEAFRILAKNEINFNLLDCSDIKKESWKDTSLMITNWMENKNIPESLFSIISPNILQRISTGEDFSTLCQHSLFTKDEESELFGFSSKMLMIFILEKIPDFDSRLVTSITKIPGHSFPILYFNPCIKNPCFKLNLKAYSSLLSYDRPMLISLGEENIGKSSLLNSLFFCYFEEENESLFHHSIDMVFSSEEYKLNMNLVDMHGDILKNILYFLPFMKIFSKESWIFLQISYENKNSGEYLKKVVELLTTSLQLKKEQILLVVKDFSKKIANPQLSKTISDLNLFEKQIFYIQRSKKSKKDDIFLSKLSELRTFLEINFGKYDQSKKPLNFPITDSRTNSYWRFEEQISKISKSQTQINLHDQKFKDFSLKMENNFKMLQNNISNLDLQSDLFKITKLQNKLNKKKKEDIYKNFKQKGDQEKISILDDYKKEIKALEMQIQETQVHELVLKYDEIIRNNNNKFRMEFESRLFHSQEPLISPLLEKRLILKKEIQELQKKIEEEEKTENNNSKTLDFNQKLQQKKKLK